jgi:hypothetical protein
MAASFFASANKDDPDPGATGSVEDPSADAPALTVPLSVTTTALSKLPTTASSTVSTTFDGGVVPIDPATFDPTAEYELLRVGEDIQPGRYTTDRTTPLCYCEVLTGPDGSFSGDVRVTGYSLSAPLVLDLLDSDYAVQIVGCGGWLPYAAPELPADHFGPGDRAVGTDIEAGRYRAEPDWQGMQCP